MNMTQVVALIAIFLLLALLSSRLRRNQLLSFVLMLLFLLGAGVLLLFVPIPHIDQGFTHSLGDSLIIAAVLAITVDVYLKERVLRQVSSDVSKYLIGYRLPGEVQDRIRGLLQTTWIRRNCTIRLRLTEIAQKPGFVKIEMAISKDLENITTEYESFREEFEYEKHLPQRILEMRCDSTDTKAQYRLDGEGLAEEKKEEPGVMQALGRKVRVPPVHEAAGKYYRFTIRYEAEFPDNYSDIVSFAQPTIGVIFEVECSHRFRVSAPPADVTSHNRWEYRKLFLPGEHIRYRWERNYEEAD